MPKPLLQRLRPDSIAEFQLSADQRFLDGETAAADNRRTAAIYLWGYAAEMTLKAAYFKADGFGPHRTITLADLRNAVDFGVNAQVFWPRQGQFHNVRAWAEVVVVRRNLAPSGAYSNASFGSEVAQYGLILGDLWNETLRYHKNVAYAYELKRFRESVEWLLAHRHFL